MLSQYNVILVIYPFCCLYNLAWINVEGVMMNTKISRKLKGKVLDSCVVPASTYGLETLALSELHEHKLQVTSM